MSKTDKTRPARLREADTTWSDNKRFIYVTSQLNWRRGLDAWSKREVRRYWHAERGKVRNALRRGDEPEPSRHRHQVRWDMY